MNLVLKTLLWGLFWRIFPAAAALAAGYALMTRSAGGSIPELFLGLVCCLIGAICLAFPVAELGALLWERLIWSKSYYAKPQPMYGIPQARRAQGRFGEALAEYETILAAHPDEVRPHLDMVEIALLDLRDPALAHALYERGRERLKKPADQEALARVYAETLTRLEPKPAAPRLEWPPPKSKA
ncbi:MAG: hypothetical protein AB7V22_11140 [Kiritimatiellia bacterium]